MPSSSCCAKIGKLERDGRERRKAIGMRCAESRHGLVLDRDHVRREVAIHVVPVGVDAEDRDVDALRVHRRDALCQRLAVERQRRPLRRRRCRRRSPQQVVGLRHRAVRMDVDGGDPPALHDHQPPRRAGALCGLRGHARDAASDEHEAGRPRDVLQECSSIGSHVRLARRDSTHSDIDLGPRRGSVIVERFNPATIWGRSRCQQGVGLFQSVRREIGRSCPSAEDAQWEVSTAPRCAPR
jgi:hypothetical protein